jgi:hypothetical protein
VKNILKSTRANAFITPDGSGYVVVAEWDVTQEEIDAAIEAEEELDRYRKCAVWN